MVFAPLLMPGSWYGWSVGLVGRKGRGASMQGTSVGGEPHTRSSLPCTSTASCKRVRSLYVAGLVATCILRSVFQRQFLVRSLQTYNCTCWVSWWVCMVGPSVPVSHLVGALTAIVAVLLVLRVALLVEEQMVFIPAQAAQAAATPCCNPLFTRRCFHVVLHVCKSSEPAGGPRLPYFRWPVTMASHRQVLLCLAACRTLTLHGISAGKQYCLRPAWVTLWAGEGFLSQRWVPYVVS